MIRKMEPWQTMDRQPGDTAVCQGSAVISEAISANTGKRTSYLALYPIMYLPREP